MSDETAVTRIGAALVKAIHEAQVPWGILDSEARLVARALLASGVVVGLPLTEDEVQRAGFYNFDLNSAFALIARRQASEGAGT
jgi:hypothetical protein